ncbi:N-6 DNA methylase [Bacillus halotolerans]|uniref:N-6 DNA methylase n=1 Tax=Bacillus halotolerans TaxID=260554 RepID=UPI000DF04DD8|nr:N-6 DNA methylase [Bacillus halotolerans]AXC51966.1 restriction endonuclease subunit M/S [Bacillus spizizenii]MEC3638715.1 N-6 DNA methylase [Bacillus halotolerans]
MEKNKWAKELYKSIRTANITGSVSKPETDLLTTGTILAVAKQNDSELSKVIQSQNVLEKVEKMISDLQLEDYFKNLMIEVFKKTFSAKYINALVNVLLNIEQNLKSLSMGEVFDELIEFVGMESRDLFLTPQSINKIATNYLLDQASVSATFHDGTAGYGQTAMMFAKEVANRCLALQEINPTAATVLRLRLFLNNVEATVAVNDLIKKPAYVKGNKLVQFDRVFMAPPFGLRLTEEQQMDMKYDRFNRFVYGIPPRSQGDLAFLSCGLSATKEDGKAAFLLPMGVLFRGGPEKEIRQRLIDFDVIEAVVALPSLLQPYTSIKTVLLLCSKNKPVSRKGKILMVNAEDLGETSNKRDAVLSEKNIGLINDIISTGKEIEEISRFITNDEIKLAQLTPSNYIYKTETQVSEFGTVAIDINGLNNVSTKPLSDLVDLYRGYNASAKDENESGEYAVLKISDIQDGEVNLEGVTRYSIKNNAKIDNNRIQQGDVLLSVRGVNRKAALFISDRDDVLLSQNFAGIRCSELLDPKFLLLYLESPIAQFYFDKHTTGTTIMTLSMKDLKELPVPLLSLDEQKKVVETFEVEQRKINEEWARIEARQKEIKLEVYEAMGINKLLHFCK